MKYNFLKIDEFRRNKILYNYWKAITATFLIPFLIINILVFSYYRHILVNQSVQNQFNILYQKQSVINNTTYEAEVTYSGLIENPLITQFLETTDENYDFDNSIPSVNSVIAPFTSLSASMESIYLYNYNLDYVCSPRYCGPITDMYDKEWYHIYEEKKQSFVTSRIINNHFYITYCFRYYPGDAEASLIVINFDLTDIFDSRMLNGSEISLYDNSGNVYKNQGNNIAMFKDDFVSSNSAIGKSGNITSFNMVKCYIKSNEGVFTLVSEKTGLFSKTQYIAIVIILIITILVTIILAFILAYILASRLYKYIANIMLSLNGQAGEDENKELNKVIETIAGNSLNSSQVESELAEKVALLRQSQTIALQTQITPHFLYNTLQAINFITIKLCGGNNDASRMIVLFSDLLHSALDTKSYLVPLKQEIGYVEQYLEIQKYKYGDKFKFILDVPEETKNLTVVKLMLQPIIENAIHHGILPTRKICRIILSAKLTSDKKLVVKISNDGVSIPPDKVLEINRCLETQKELTQSNHIGLPNVNRRIKLIFGEEYGCSVHSTEELTIITITLPA